MVHHLYNFAYNTWSRYNLSKKLACRFKNYSSHVKMVNLTIEQKKSIQNYFTPIIGRKVSTKWHRLLTSLTKTFNPEFLPFDIYHILIEKLSPWKYTKILDDKNLYRQLFKDFKIPERIIESSLGNILIIENQKVKKGASIYEAINYSLNLGDCIIKPSINSSAGNGIIKVNFRNGIDTISGIPITNIFSKIGKNYTIERIIQENNNLKVLNPDSCNTLRVHTYRNPKGEIFYVSSFIRMGRKGNFLDNAGKGGICCKINDSGKLENNCSWTSTTWSYVSHSDNGIELNGYVIENFEEIKSVALRAHSVIPYFDFIGWDLAIDEENKIVIIEYNPNPDMRLDQVWYRGSCLQNLQPEILKNIFL